jgi:hypothetical protein
MLQSIKCEFQTEVYVSYKYSNIQSNIEPTSFYPITFLLGQQEPLILGCQQYNQQIIQPNFPPAR